MQRRKRRGINRVDFIVLGIVSCISLLLLNSAEWVKYAWEGIDFSTIMFQMHTPLNGVNNGILRSFYSNCVLQTVQEILVIIIIYWMLKCPFEKLTFSFNIKFFQWKQQWALGKNNKVWRMVPKVYFVGILLWYGYFLYFAALDIGVFNYFQKINTRSMIFESEYVDPEDIDLVFPEKKRNLVLIYLESMETTYASTEVGGGKTINYIPKLTELAENNINFSSNSQFGGGM